MDPLFLAGLAVLALLTISPGADMALVAKITLERGRRDALLATMGIAPVSSFMRPHRRSGCR